MISKIVILSLLGFVNVFGQIPCTSHHNFEQRPEPSDVQRNYLAPEATDQFKEYLPPVEFQPLAAQPKPVYVSAPVHKEVIQPLPKLQPLPQTTYVKPVYQPLPKLAPLPQPTYQPIKPLPKLQPLKSIYVQPLPSSTIRPLPKITLSPKQYAPPKISYLPQENEVQASNTVGVKYDNQFFVKKINTVPQATNIKPEFTKLNPEPAAQTNRLSYANPDPDGIRINHYICEIGDAQQKFLCDILKLWDRNHPKELNSNDLDNPVDNSNNNPLIARLPSTQPPTYIPPPLPTTTTTITTTTTQAPIQPELLPGDSQQNENAIYLPPYSTTARPTFAPTTIAQTTVEIPKRITSPPLELVTPSDTRNSAQYTYTSPITSTTTLAPPAKEGYDYPKPAIPFPPPTIAPVKDGYDYPRPAIPFTDGAFFPAGVENSFSNNPFASFAAPSPSFGPALSPDSSPYNVPLPSFSDGLRYQSLSPIVTSTTLSPDYFVKSNIEFQNSPAFSYNLQPLNTFGSYNGDSFSSISPYTLSTPAPPISYSTPAAYYSHSTPSVSTLAPLLLSKESLALSSDSQLSTNQAAFHEKSSVPSGLSNTLPNSFNYDLYGQYFNSLSPLQYNSISHNPDQSLLGSKSNTTNFNYQPIGQTFTTTSPLSYSFKPSGPSSISGLSNSQINLASSGLTNNPPTQTPFKFQKVGQSSVSSSGQISSLNNPPSTNYQSFSQSSQSFAGPALSSKSGLTFGPNVQSVENLKNLQATGKSFDIDLRFGPPKNQEQTSSLNDDSDSPLSGGGYRRTGSDSKGDISLGNIEILKVKRKL